ncbi:hypothetical protein RRF57_002226 [Xylaria bambusicola]|uniref:Carrier domain-containing protein n=1 Tax=Xylaria bambusicola TaxID=326684 RepID=A0AAN7Z6R5_9PEZI
MSVLVAIFYDTTDIIIVEQLPQLPSGKIDRKRLIHGYSVRTKNATGNGIPIDDFERLLCELATAILGEKVGPLTEFSAANMDSLAAIEYSSALRDNGVFVNTVDILSAKSPRGLRPRARGIGMQTISPESESHSKIYQDSDLFQEKAKLKYMLGDQVQEIDRLEWPTPLQHSMIAETLKDGHLYINQIELEVTSDAALDVLQPSLRKLAECNEILRTGLPS